MARIGTLISLALLCAALAAAAPMPTPVPSGAATPVAASSILPPLPTPGATPPPTPVVFLQIDCWDNGIPCSLDSLGRYSVAQGDEVTFQFDGSPSTPSYMTFDLAYQPTAGPTQSQELTLPTPSTGLPIIANELGTYTIRLHTAGYTSNQVMVNVHS